MPLSSILAYAMLLQPQARQTIVDDGRPEVVYPSNQITELHAACPQGQVLFSFSNLPGEGRRRVQRLAVGRVSFSPDTTAILESLFGSLRADYASIVSCGSVHDDAIQISVNFVLPRPTPGRTTYVATVYIRDNAIAIHPHDLDRLRGTEQ